MKVQCQGPPEWLHLLSLVSALTHRHDTLWTSPDKTYKHNLLISAYLPTNLDLSGI